MFFSTVVHRSFLVSPGNATAPSPRFVALSGSCVLKMPDSDARLSLQVKVHQHIRGIERPTGPSHVMCDQISIAGESVAAASSQRTSLQTICWRLFMPGLGALAPVQVPQISAAQQGRLEIRAPGSQFLQSPATTTKLEGIDRYWVSTVPLSKTENRW